MTQNTTDDTLDPTTQEGMEDAAGSPVEYAEQDEAVSSTASRSRLFWLWRSAIVRIVVIVLFVVVLAAVIGTIIYSSTRTQRGQILPVDVYPSAALVGKRSTPNSDTQTYSTKAAFPLVYDFYVQHIATADGSGCQKIYVGKVESENPGQVSGKCFILNAFQDANQLLSVSITTQLTPDGKADKTFIVIERSWKG